MRDSFIVVSCRVDENNVYCHRERCNRMGGMAKSSSNVSRRKSGQVQYTEDVLAFVVFARLMSNIRIKI